MIFNSHSVAIQFLVLLNSYFAKCLHIKKNFHCYDECHSLIPTIGQFCTKPISHRILSQISYRTNLPSHWECIGYELIAEHEVENIQFSKDDVQKNCFTMLKKWLETDRGPCYCKLFAALETYEYHDLLRKVKEIITS